MNRKITCIILLLAITLSALPTTLAVQTQVPRRIVEEIDTRTPPPAVSTCDLTVTNIAFNPTSPAASDVVTITATIKNIGSAQSGNSKVEFYSDDELIAATTIGRLKSDRSVATSTTYSFEEGVHSISVIVDPNSQVTETNENNNEGVAPLIVGSWQPIHNVAISNIIPSKTSIQPGETITINVEISNLGNQEESATITAYVDGLSIGSKPALVALGSTITTVSFSWTAPQVTGTHTISADATITNQDIDTSDNQKTYGPITVATYSYTLNIEIDYMPGHEPTQAVLNYMQTYYAARGIQVTYQIATSAVPLDTSVTTRDFWAIEANYNAGTDNANGNPNNGKYTLPDKWVLFGTAVSGQPSVVGYCYTTGSSSDLLSGNYIYIADRTSDNWAGSDITIQTGAEATILMHEVGHAIGIAILGSSGSEVYCSDSTCVMSYLNQQNAKNINNCHYCDAHWGTKNLNYYAI